MNKQVMYSFKSALLSIGSLTNLAKMPYRKAIMPCFQPSPYYSILAFTFLSVFATLLSSQLLAKDLINSYSGTNDIEAITLQRNGLVHLLEHMDQRSDIFNRLDNKKAIGSRKQKEDA